MSAKTIGLGLIVVGVVGLAVSLLADQIGIGQNPQVIGPIQLGGAALGLVVALIGVFLARRKAKAKA
jgi:cation transporter-like permease